MKYLAALLCFIPACLVPAFAHAATTVYFEAPTSSVTVGSALPVKVLIDSNEPLNAYSLDIRYPAGLLNVHGINNASSLITIWRGNPTISESGDIVVKGGSIAPFLGSGGEIIELDLVPSASGTATLSFASAAAYLANGKGTKITPQTKAVSVSIAEATGTASAAPAIFPSEVGDITPPSLQSLSLVADPFNPHQKLLVFSVNDSGSGMKEIDIRYRSLFFWSAWQAARNPTSLSAGVWEVDFRAIDNAGNITEQVLYDWGALWTLVGIAGAIILVIAIIVVILYRFLR